MTELSDCLGEFAIWTYLVAIVLSAYLTYEFYSWYFWGKRNDREVSDVFLCFMILFPSWIYMHGIALLVRIVDVLGHNEFALDIRMTWWWKLRMVPFIIGLGKLTYHMIRQKRKRNAP